MDIQTLTHWEDLVSAGIECREHIDSFRWVMCALAGRVDTVYGRSSLREFGNSVGLSERTITLYRQVQNYWNAHDRCAVFEEPYPNISFSHRVIAMQRIPNVNEADEVLQIASNESWTVDRLKVELNDSVEKMHNIVLISRAEIDEQLLEDLHLRIRQGEKLLGKFWIEVTEDQLPERSRDMRHPQNMR